MTEKTVPDIVISRLPKYLQTLEHLSKQNIHFTSSQALGVILGISAAQIRKDLSQFGEFGKQGTGYPVEALITQLRTILHINQSWDLALVGIGDLGTALARYQGFENHGFNIVLAFDNDPEKVNKTIGNVTIQSTDDMIDSIKNQSVKIAMLTVPASQAQSVAEELVEAGIQAIISYAPISLTLPPTVHVDYVDPILKIQHMTYYLD